MKTIVLFYLSLLAITQLSAQSPLPLVQANSVESFFIEGDNGLRNGWWLDPQIDLDIYRTNKHADLTQISFHTDIDSIQFKLAPGEKFDFLVVLKGQDTCRTRVEIPAPIQKWAKQVPATHDTIPFSLTSGNNLKVRVLLNDTDSLDLFFDTGATEIVLTHTAIREKTQLLAGLPPDYQTRDYHPLPTPSSLQIGKTRWEKLRIYPVSHTGQETDGHFGWDLFDGRLVEVNYEQHIFVIHSSLQTIPDGFARLPIEYLYSLFCIQGTLYAGNHSSTDRYLFDTGYQKSLLLDRDLRIAGNFPTEIPVLHTDSLRNGSGQWFITPNILTDTLDLGGAKAYSVPTQLLTSDNPARFPTHILGNDLLRQFNLILDFQNNWVYLQAKKLG